MLLVFIINMCELHDELLLLSFVVFVLYIPNFGTQWNPQKKKKHSRKCKFCSGQMNNSAFCTLCSLLLIIQREAFYLEGVILIFPVTLCELGFHCMYVVGNCDFVQYSHVCCDPL